jgi:hypothetical protein
MAGVFCLMAAVSARAQDGPWNAQIWDSDINLPMGGYRAAQPIELDGKINITMVPGTMIDNVVFHGAQAAQHYHLHGVIMNLVKLNGQLGVSMDAKTCVFQNCEMDKIGAWFVDMWGSHWKFDNCVFTEKLINDAFSVGNYSVYATDCTFYDVKLPTITFKNDPGIYLQKKNFAFVNCHFIRCDVPRSFIAATSGCEFEDCEFSSKKVEWPGQVTPLQVTAYYTGMGDAPQGFTDGPLTVSFSEAPANETFGSKLPHTEDQGEVKVNGYTPPQEFANFGSVQKRSSEIAPASALTSGAAPAGQ